MGEKIDFKIRNFDQRLYFKEKGSDRLKTLGVIQDIDSFIVSLWQTLQLHRPQLVFEPAYPPYVLDSSDAQIARGGRDAPEIPEEIITWTIIRRTPGSIDHKPFARSREIRPRVREELVYEPKLDVDPREEETYCGPGAIGANKELARVSAYEIRGQFFDNLIQFDIWSKNNKTAEKLANYLEEFMEDFHGMFIELGVNKLHFHSRIRDEVILNWRNGLINRSLLFFVRTERVRLKSVREIKSIHISAETREYLNIVERYGIEKIREITSQQLISDWVQRNQNL